MIKEEEKQLDNRLQKYIAGLYVCMWYSMSDKTQDFASKGYIITLHSNIFWHTGH